MKASVDKNACIGCGLCVEMCPEFFEMDPLGISETTTTEVSAYHITEVMNAVDACPTNAIHLG